MPNPLVSVIIPTFNREFFIKDAIDSVLNQTFQDFEIVVIDDGSTDNTKDIIDGYNDYRIHYFYQKNRGLNPARNAGIKNSRGNYIAFLDSDDIWEPDKLEKQVEILNQKPEIGLVYCGSSLIDENKNFIGKRPLITYKGDVFKKLVMYNFLYNGSVVLFRKSCIEKVGLFDETITRMTDWEFYLRFSVYFKYWGIDEYLIKYRVHKKTMSNDFELFENSGFKILNRVFQMKDIETRHLRLVNMAYAMRYRYIGRRHFENNLFEKARNYFKEALRRAPSAAFRSDVLLFYLLSHLPQKNIDFLRNLKKNTAEILINF